MTVVSVAAVGRDVLRARVDAARRERVAADRRRQDAAVAAYHRSHPLDGAGMTSGDLGGLLPEVYAMPRCVYCGRPRSSVSVACHMHRDLVGLDPKYRERVAA